MIWDDKPIHFYILLLNKFDKDRQYRFTNFKYLLTGTLPCLLSDDSSSGSESIITHKYLKQGVSCIHSYTYIDYYLLNKFSEKIISVFSIGSFHISWFYVMFMNKNK